jgi:hypothetical protein
LYGQAPHPSGDWFEVPPAILGAYAQMQPRIEAERALQRIGEMGAGSGAMPEADQRTQLANLRRAARGHAEPVQKASAGDLAAMGISIIGDM